MRRKSGVVRARGLSPFQQNYELSIKYAQLVTKPLTHESRFISIQKSGREPDGQYSRDAEQAGDTRCDLSPAWLELAPPGRRAAGVETEVVSGCQGP